MTKLERLQLNQMSKDIFGKASYWQRLWKKGALKPKNKRLAGTSDIVYFLTVESLIAYMLEAKAQADSLIEKMKPSVADDSSK